MYSYMIHLWASLSGKVCSTSLMKKRRPSLLGSPGGMYVSMSSARSGVRQFFSLVFIQCCLYSFECTCMRSAILSLERSSCSFCDMYSGRSKYISRKLRGYFYSSGWKCVMCWFLAMVGFSASVKK
jgi:hypothetical protein